MSRYQLECTSHYLYAKLRSRQSWLSACRCGSAAAVNALQIADGVAYYMADEKGVSTEARQADAFAAAEYIIMLCIVESAAPSVTLPRPKCIITK
jgi:hypothetical protein